MQKTTSSGHNKVESISKLHIANILVFSFLLFHLLAYPRILKYQIEVQSIMNWGFKKYDDKPLNIKI